MNSRKRARYIAKSMASVLKRKAKDIRLQEGSYIKEIAKNRDYQAAEAFIEKVSIESIEATIAFENQPHKELQGMTFAEYFDSLDNIEQFIEIATAVLEEENSFLPLSFVEKLESMSDTMKKQLNDYITNIKTGPDAIMSPEQRVAVQICGIVKSESFIEPLINFMTSLPEDARADDFECVCDALINIGLPALEPLVNEVERVGKGFRAYNYMLLAIAKIGSKNRSEKIYQFLKDKFRKSDVRLVEANALSLYGDGRAIPAIRGYVERNIEKLTLWEYNNYRDIVESLGGDMSDLDRFFYGPGAWDI